MRKLLCVALAPVGMFVALAFACSDSTAPSRTWNAEIRGVVRDSSGNPVPGALVAVQTIDIGESPRDVRGRCRGVLNPITTVTASGNGSYSVDVKGIARPVNVCVFVDATGTLAGKAVAGGAEVDSISIGPSPLDAVEIDIVARP